jgi:hypothetical protein
MDPPKKNKCSARDREGGRCGTAQGERKKTPAVDFHLNTVVFMSGPFRGSATLEWAKMRLPAAWLEKLGFNQPLYDDFTPGSRKCTEVTDHIFSENLQALFAPGGERGDDGDGLVYTSEDGSYTLNFSRGVPVVSLLGVGYDIKVGFGVHFGSNFLFFIVDLGRENDMSIVERNLQ